jgi:aminodeoxyfutalosine deaminase
LITAHAAPVVVTMTGDPLLDQAVVVDGGVVAEVVPTASLPETVRVRRHRGVLLPGLVNAHAHLEYGPSFADLATSGLPFPQWIAELTRRRRALSADDWLVEARGSAHAALSTGTTSVGDVVTHGPGAVARTRLGLRGTSYVEAVGADTARWEAGERERVEGLLSTLPGELGVSPHTLYTLGSQVFTAAVGLARSRGLRVHPHLAETAAEAEYVLAGTGPLADFPARMGLLFELAGVGAGVSPTAHCDALGGLGPDVHVAHGVHVDAADRALLRERGTAVALCTRSNAILAAGEAPVADYLAEGSPVALGTDSLASSPDLDLLAEARACRDLARRQGCAAPEEALLAALTVGGAAALGIDAGTVEPGRPADLCVVDVPVEGARTQADVAAAVIEHGAGRCTATVLAGRLVHRRA